MGNGCAKIKKTKKSEVKVDAVLNRLQKVSVVFGTDIQKLNADDKKTLIVFIFGGPGSFKGRVVDDLVQAYNFTYLNAESLVLDHLPQRLHLASSTGRIVDLIQFLNDDDSCLSLEWLFQILSNRIDRKPGASYLIDVVTNLRVFLRSKSLNKGHAACLQRFEEKYPVLFAINLAIPKDKVILNVASHCAQTTSGHSGCVDRESQSQSDEVDLSKTQKRASLYESNAKPFLDYFSSRLISVDVSCAMPDSISFKICDILREQLIVPITAPKSNILISFCTSDYPGLDLSLYGFHKISLADVVTTANTLMEQLACLCEEIMKKLCVYRNLYVELDSTKLTKESIEHLPSKGVSFVEVLDDRLDHFVPVDARIDSKKLYTTDLFRSIVSPDGDMCLFHTSVDTTVCVKLARFIAESKISHRSSSNNSERSVRVNIEVMPFNPVDC